ncbi:MAG: hypothetical protein LBK25_09235 [Treponema sp.]|nr:hypothetical protein [Treponema sp.]
MLCKRNLLVVRRRRCQTRQTDGRCLTRQRAPEGWVWGVAEAPRRGAVDRGAHHKGNGLPSSV